MVKCPPSSNTPSAWSSAHTVRTCMVKCPHRSNMHGQVPTPLETTSCDTIVMPKCPLSPSPPPSCWSSARSAFVGQVPKWDRHVGQVPTQRSCLLPNSVKASRCRTTYKRFFWGDKISRPFFSPERGRIGAFFSIFRDLQSPLSGRKKVCTLFFPPKKRNIWKR